MNGEDDADEKKTMVVEKWVGEGCRRPGSVMTIGVGGGGGGRCSGYMVAGTVLVVTIGECGFLRDERRRRWAAQLREGVTVPPLSLSSLSNKYYVLFPPPGWM
ncbi:hypothetical protein PIB30_101266 [Stylosanthes scabra]|uniref:Uncharacterized protein n=1 Tax=Stylosanthes scabra TaxID=79078 RepID=A0ABU6UXK6_9FABA|nr:hypothetical protein [Stylosanthes scabra]